MMKWVYIASPYKGDIDANTVKARRYCRFAARQTCVPICPHIYVTQFLDDFIPEEREAGLFLGLQLMTKCDELWVFGERITEGMVREIEFAKRHDITVVYHNEQCEVQDGRH